MIKFLAFLAEASSLESEKLGHLSHLKDIPHEDPSKAKEALDLIKGFHQHKLGKSNAVTGQLKVDGGASVVVGHDNEGTFVSDKHRFDAGKVARTPEEVEQHFGHHPQYAAQLNNVLEHAHKFVKPGHTVQGDLMFTEHEKNKQSVTPNRITYGAKHNAKIGIAAHTEITGGAAHAITSEAIQKHKDVFIPQSEYKPTPNTYKPEDQKAVEKHVSEAETLFGKHSTEHLTPEHVKHFTAYIGKSVKEGKEPTVEGYKKHLAETGVKEAKKLKTPTGQQKKIAAYKTMQSQVDANKEHFQRTVDIRHHLGQATEHLLKDIHHPDMTTSIDKKPSAGEGIVLLKKDKIGVKRPVAKLVPQEISHAIRNNPRFA